MRSLLTAVMIFTASLAAQAEEGDAPHWPTICPGVDTIYQAALPRGLIQATKIEWMNG